jgi:hypothetical protein
VNDFARDPVIEALALLIRDRVDRGYSQVRQSRERLIQSLWFYDAYQVPLTEFPLLKVYRRDLSFQAQDVRTSSVVVNFAFANADIEAMPGLLYWVANETVRAVGTWRVEHSGLATISPSIQANAVTSKFPGDTLVYEMEMNLQIQN